jgi:ATP-dependent Clp protease ATP-binding subunit ClpC
MRVYTRRSEDVRMRSNREARRRGLRYIGSNLILYGVLQVGGIATRALETFGVTAFAVRDYLDDTIPSPATNYSGEITYLQHVYQILRYAADAATELGDGEIEPEHTLLGLIRYWEMTQDPILRELGIDTNQLKDRLLQSMANSKRASPKWPPGSNGFVSVLDSILTPKDSRRRHLS